MAETYTLADLMREREERTPTLGGPPQLPGLSLGTEPPLAQHNLIDRALSSFGRPSLEAVQAAQRGEATPRDVAWEFLTNGPMGPMGGVRVPNPIRAYHGSPHTFDEFRMDRVGSGEGAQAYGHGLYFAENPRVAQQYRDELTRSGIGNPYVGGRPLERSTAGDYAHGLAFDDLVASGGNVPAAIERVQGARPNTGIHRGLHDRMETVLRDWERQGVEMRPGSMYEVNLHARPEQFLELDRPLSEQSRHVSAALDRVGVDPNVYMLGGHGILDPRSAWPPPYRGRVNIDPAESHVVTGRTALEQLGERRGPFGLLSRTPRRVSETLSEAGVPGARYLDQGSRGAGEGTRNYVVFNPEIIESLRRYGIVAPPAGAALAAGLSDETGP